jgi:hypothetical protein
LLQVVDSDPPFRLNRLVGFVTPIHETHSVIAKSTCSQKSGIGLAAQSSFIQSQIDQFDQTVGSGRFRQEIMFGEQHNTRYGDSAGQ